MTSRKTRPDLAIGIDFGGTFIKLGLVDRLGKIRHRLSLEVRKGLSRTKLLEQIYGAIHSLRQGGLPSSKKLAGVGMGLPGLIDTERGWVHFLTNVPGWENLPLARQMAKRLRLPVFIDNDVNLMTLGEATYGAARGCRQVICLTLGTGVGGGLIVNGHLYRGANLSAGEIGHMPVNREGPPCPCGGRGCLERYVGNQAIVRLAKERLRGEKSSLILKLLKGNLRQLTPQTLHEAAKRGDRLARCIWQEVGEWIGIALTGLVNTFDPERIVIGGGVAQAGPFLLTPIRRTLRERALAWPVKHLKVVRATLGNDAGIIGGAVLVRDSLG